MGIVGLHNRVRISSVWVIFILCYFFAYSGKAQTPSYTWARSAGTGSDQEANAVTADLNGNVYVTGYISSSNNNFSSILVTASGADDIFIAKYDLDGNITWAKAAGGAGNDYGASIAVDNAGNVYVCGIMDGSTTFFGSPNITLSATGNEGFVAKYNSAGNVLWAKRIACTGESIAKSVCTDGSNVFITGQFDGTCAFGALPVLTSSNKDVFIASYNASTGTEQWAIKGGSGADDIGSGIACDGTGVYVAGTYDGTITFQNMSGTLSNNGAGDLFVVKYNLSGTGIWKRRAGGTADDHDVSLALSGPYVYVCGHTHSNPMSFYDTGPAVGTLTTASGEDAFVAQWNATTGNYGWSRCENGSGADRAAAVAANPAGDVFVTGYFNGTLPCGSGPALVSNGDDVFVTKYNTAGTFQWGKKVAGNADDYGKGIVAPDNTSIYVVGAYKSTPATFDAFTISSTSNFDIFTAKIGCTVTVANAGADQTICSSSAASLTGNTPITGTGAWSVISGTGTVDSPSSPTSTLSGLTTGTHVFQWTITNSVCPASTFDQVTITVDSIPTTANAGPDQSICSSSGTLAGNAPTIGNGTWTLISGSGSPTTPSSPTSAFTGILTGTNVFQWSITNGVCPASTDQVTITRDPNPTTANAGSDQTICSPSAVFAGNTPVIGTGAWTLISGTGTITNAASPTSPVNSLSTGTNTFQWTISNGSCPPSSDQVSIIVDANPTTANAGPDQTICSSSSTFAANVPAIGSGIWTLISGTGTVTVPSSATSAVTGLSVGANVFRWTISNGTCPPSFDEITITRDAAPTTANAGPDQTLCATTATFAANTPAIGTGLWTLISGTGVISSPSSPNSTVNGLSVGANVFQWTISNGTCAPSTDQVTINVDPFPTVANAGPDQNICSGAATLAGNAPVTGTGFWSLVSGTGSITSPTSPTSGLTGLSVGPNVFRWTITSGTCPSSFDNVTITRDANPTTANAGTDQTLCTSTTSLAGNAPAIGTGVWTLISGSGSVTTPSSNTSGVTGLTTGASVFQWTISNGTCPSSSDQVTINHDASPTAANAGIDQTVCASTSTFTGNVPTTGTGLWTLISGTGIIGTPTSASSGVSGLSVGPNVFQWTISNGTCPSSSDQITITRDPNSSAANAGPDQTICSSSTSLAANAPSIGTGTWTLISGTGTIIAPTSPTSTVTGLSIGANVFRWAISNGVCPPSNDQVTITVDVNPTAANAGPNQTACSSTATLAGNNPAVGTGAWTLVSGTGTIVSPSSPTSAVTGLGIGPNVFQWTISNGTCPPSSDQITITRDANPTTANAGVDQTICSSSASFAANTPAIGTGMWALISGTGTIVTPTSPTSSVNGLSIGANVFQWTTSNGTCPSSSDQITITRDANPTTANAGPDQTICATTATFGGNNPVVGAGAWTLVSGTGTIVSPSSPTSAVNGLGIGANVFQWTISNGTCSPSSDQITITRDANPTTANAGVDQTICASSTAFTGNTPAIGTGVWTLISGTGTIVTPSSPTSSVTGLSVGANVFEWTISNGTCPSSSDQVTIIVDPPPTASNAGTDQTLCTATTSLAANNPAIGTGTWTLISGTGTIVTPSSPTSSVTGLSVGANVFQWTISNGTCPSSSDQVTIFRDPNPTAANAGSDQTICSSSATLAGNIPTTGTGIWTLISGTGTIVTPSSPTSSVTGLSVGANVFEWTTSNGTCPSSSDQVTINVDPNPTASNAGVDQTLCAATTFLSGNTPTTGTGTWTLISGTGTIVTPSSPTSSVTGLAMGANVFQWTITNGTCPPSSDQVTIFRDANPTTANAGTDQTICSSSTALAGNSPAIGTGAWTLISGTGTIATPSSPTSTVTGLSLGANVFEWTISNGTCPSSSDQVTINVDPNPTAANAGANQTICSSTATFAGNIPSVGTGTWTLISGTGTIATPSSPTSSVTGLSIGANVFQWTISNGTCPSSSDQVVITRDANPTVANAGSDQTICSSSSSLAGNAPVIGSGTWTLISGPATISAPTSNTSPVTGMVPGTATFEWTISNGTCPSTSDQVTIYIDANPTPANAGSDQTICSSSASVSGNAPSIGNGVWTLISGTGIIATPSSTTSAITGLSIGANIFQWTISNGTCPSSTDQVTINVDANPTTANAGQDQTICSAGASLNGNTPTTGTGTWYLISGTGTIVSPNSPNSVVNGLSPGANVFKWEITNGTCPASNDVVTIFHDSAPTASNAGTDQTICSSAATLSGNTPTTGSGNWTLISGTGNIISPASPTTAITGLGIGANVFEWTISNGTCPSSSDQVIINVDANPTIANAGNDQTICTSAAVLGGNTPLAGNGIWNVISGTGIISNPSQPSSNVTNLGTGINLFEWVISNGVCPSSHDTVTVFIEQYPTIANAGSDQQICSSSSQMSGNIPVVGAGSWNVISSTGNFANATLPNSAITNLGTGANTFEWVITNGTCPASRDTVTILVDDFPSAANAGPDQLICSSTSALQATNPTIGVGTWSVLNGPSSITNVLLPNSPVTNLAPGQNEFKWTVTNGVCPVSTDTVQIYLDSLPTTANAGVSQTLCSNVSSLNANVPLTGSGQWFIVSSAASLANATQPSTAVTGLGIGQNLFEWVISNGVCPASRDTVSITVDENPTQALAGADLSVCDPFDTLHGNIPLVGSGTWYSLSSPPLIANPFTATTAVSNLAAGTNTFEWVISNGSCPATRDTVSILYTLRPSAPNAGPDLFECTYDVTMQAEIPSTGTGYWTNLSNTGSFSDPANPNTVLNNVPDGTYAYTWTTSNSYCVSRADTVFVTVYSPPTFAYAGVDQVVHTNFTTLDALACDTGFGTWSFVSGSGQIQDVNDPKSRVTDLANGINILRWTTSNGVCATTEDEMQIESKALIIPTGYSPNADGTNDAFVIEGLLEYSNVSLEIFNRWGNRVYASPDYKNDWNGVGGNGEILPDDIYYFVLKLEDGTAFNGYVALKRKSS